MGKKNKSERRTKHTQTQTDRQTQTQTGRQTETGTDRDTDTAERSVDFSIFRNLLLTYKRSMQSLSFRRDPLNVSAIHDNINNPPNDSLWQRFLF